MRLIWLGEERGQGAPRGPGGPPYFGVTLGEGSDIEDAILPTWPCGPPKVMKTTPGHTSPNNILMQRPAARSREVGARFSTVPRIAAGRKPTAIGLGDYGQVAAGRLTIGRRLPTCPTKIVAAREDWNE